MMSTVQVRNPRSTKYQKWLILRHCSTKLPTPPRPDLKNNFQAPLCARVQKRGLITVQEELYILTYFLEDPLTTHIMS